MSAGPQGVQRFSRRGVPLLAAFIVAAVSLVAVPIAFLFLLDLSGEFFAILTPILGGVGGAGPGDITSGAGSAWVVFGTIGVLSIPAALLIAALMGGNSPSLSREPPRPPRSGGPPF